MTQPARFVDTGETLADFADLFLVVCPYCAACARVTPHEPGGDVFSARRLVCPSCGLIRERERGSVAFGEPVDSYFGEPLWLTAPCCGETLWAYNPRHLAYLDGFLSADLREEQRGFSTRTVANRLPAWMKSAKNRPEVLRALRKLKERCPG